MGWYDQVVVQRPDVGSARDLITGAGQVTQSLQNAIAPLTDIASNQRTAIGNQMARDAVSQLMTPDLVNGSLNDVMAYKNAVNNAMAYGDKDTQALLGKTASDYENAWNYQQQQMYQNKSLAQAAELANAKNETELKAAMINKDAMIKAHQIMAAAQNHATDMNYLISKSNLDAQRARTQFEISKSNQELENKMNEDYLNASQKLHTQDFLDAIRRNNSNGFWNADVTDRDISKVGEAVEKLLKAKVITPAYAAQTLTGLANPGGFRSAISTLSNFRSAPQVDALGRIVYQTDKDGNIVNDKSGKPIPVMVDLKDQNPLIGKYYDAPWDWGPLVPFFGMSGIRTPKFD
jgi:hypothetical protein